MIKNARRWAPSGPLAYAGAAAALAAAFGLRYAFQPVLEDRLAFVSFTICAMLVEYYAGLAPALLVTAGGLLLGVYFFVPPYDELLMPEAQDLIFIGGYLSVALLGILLIESLQRAKYELRLLKELAQSQLEMLERSDAGRTRAEHAARRSDERFESLASGLQDVWYMRRLDGNFEYVNDRFYEYTGTAPGSLEEDGWLKAVHPDDIEEVTTAWERVCETGDERESSLRLRMADGSYRRFEGLLSCVDSKGGKIIKWVGASTPPASANISAAGS